MNTTPSKSPAAADPPQASGEFDLEACAREPIHIPGTIQPHGHLLAFEGDDLRLVHSSAAAAGEVLPANLEEAFGLPLERILRVRSLKRLHDSLRQLPERGPLQLGAYTVPVTGAVLLASAHRSPDGLAVLELETTPPAEAAPVAATTLARLNTLILDAFDRLGAARTVEDIVGVAAREVRRITGFDRVLVYRFDAKWDGVVIAEDRNNCLPSYLGLRFPASDIPGQARRLYAANRLRLIPNVDYTPVPILPGLHPRTGRPLDLSFAVLRSVSPVHREYMRNMGTPASMSVSLLRGAKLWGLISCHHAEPRYMPFAARAACDLIGQMLAARIAVNEEAAHTTERERLQAVKDRLFARIPAAEGKLHERLADDDAAADLCALTGAAGAAVLTRSGCALVGQTPPEAEVRRLVEWLQQREMGEIFITHALGTEMPEADTLTNTASGVVAVQVSPSQPSFVLWFRPELVLTVNWGGDPHKAVEIAEAGTDARRLSPRHSFESWKEMVRGTSAPWTPAEVEAARELRRRIIESMLRRSEARLRELQSELLHVSRLSAAGEMAAALAHELHQPLTAVAGAVEAVGLMLASSPLATQVPGALREAVDLASEQSLRAGQIVRRLRAFVAKGKTEVRAEDLRRLIEEAAALALVGAKDFGITVSFRFHPALPPVLADRIQIQQVLVNLIRNAVEAMADAGDGSGTQRRELVMAAAPAGPSLIEVSVADTGPGLAPGLAERPFEAFASTKPGGLGIGLSISRTIVEAHGGRIWAEPNPGGGTVFLFTLPAVGTTTH